MKKTALIILCLFIIMTGTFSQVCDFYEDYTDDTDWTFVYGYPGAGGCGDEPQTGTLQITGGVMDFSSVCDANDTRMYRDLGFTLSNESWTANFEFTPTAIGADGVPRVGHVIFALSAGYNCPFNDSWEHCIANDQDGIMVWYLSEYTPHDPTTGFYIYAKNGPTYVNTAVGENITAAPGTTYFLTFKRLASNFVTLEVYLDASRTELLDAINCFEIPDNITDLNVLQHANAPWGYYKRVLSGTIDNTCIYNNTTAIADIIGPTSICSGDSALYALSEYGGGTIDWTIPDEITYSELSPSEIIITDWGGLTDVTIGAIIMGECGLDTISTNVAVLHADTSYINYTICKNDTLLLWGLEISSAGEYVYSTTGITGCDSVIVANVSEADTIFTEIHYTICSGDSILINNMFITASGEYLELLATANGCDSQITHILQLYPESQINIVEDTLIINTSGNTIITELTGELGTISWYPILGLSCIDCLNPYITWDESGWYYVTFLDANGCVSVDSIYILFETTTIMDLPSAFTPNGDGFNDNFGIANSGNCAIAYFNIYNRWGELIFTTNNINDSWNGYHNNIAQEIGTYVYLVNGYCGEQLFNLTGTFTLVR